MGTKLPTLEHLRLGRKAHSESPILGHIATPKIGPIMIAPITYVR